MNKVAVFEGTNCELIEREINLFSRYHEVIDVSISSIKGTYTNFHTVIILYKE